MNTSLGALRCCTHVCRLVDTESAQAALPELMNEVFEVLGMTFPQQRAQVSGLSQAPEVARPPAQQCTPALSPLLTSEQHTHRQRLAHLSSQIKVAVAVALDPVNLLITIQPAMGVMPGLPSHMNVIYTARHTVDKQAWQFTKVSIAEAQLGRDRGHALDRDTQTLIPVDLLHPKAAASCLSASLRKRYHGPALPLPLTVCTAEWLFAPLFLWTSCLSQEIVARCVCGKVVAQTDNLMLLRASAAQHAQSAATAAAMGSLDPLDPMAMVASQYASHAPACIACCEGWRTCEVDMAPEDRIKAMAGMIGAAMAGKKRPDTPTHTRAGTSTNIQLCTGVPTALLLAECGVWCVLLLCACVYVGYSDPAQYNLGLPQEFLQPFEEVGLPIFTHKPHSRHAL